MSTLPFWLETLVIGVVFFVCAGLFAPYVSGEDQEKARKVDRFYDDAPMDGLVPITIRSRVDLPGLGFYPVLMLILVADVAYCVEEAATAVAATNLFVVIIAVLIVDALLWVGILLAMSFAAMKIERDLEVYYRRTYYVDVKHDIEFIRI